MSNYVFPICLTTEWRSFDHANCGILIESTSRCSQCPSIEIYFSKVRPLNWKRTKNRPNPQNSYTYITFLQIRNFFHRKLGSLRANSPARRVAIFQIHSPAYSDLAIELLIFGAIRHANITFSLLCLFCWSTNEWQRFLTGIYRWRD